MSRVVAAVLLTLTLLAGAARASDLAIAGLEADSERYAAALLARAPAGGTPAARRAAEQKAAEAERRRDWAAASAAYESRLSLGEPTVALWMSLAQAQVRRAPSDPQHALLAADQAFQLADTPAGAVPPLLVIADALRALDRPAQALTALEAAAERAPDDARIRQSLADARRAAGLMVREVRTEDETDPPRACIAFTTPPARRDDFHPQDWVTLDPPVADAAITREGDQICVSGLPFGATTTIVLRAGLPGEDGLALNKPARLVAAIGNRAPRIAFDQRLFILPRGQATAVTMTTVNLASVKLTLARMTERNVLSFLRANKLGAEIDADAADSIGNDYGRVVWQGSVDIARTPPNKNARTALPLPDALTGAGPGVYALIATSGDGGPQRYDAPQSVQMIVRTDLAPTVWRGADGLTMQVRGYSDARVRAGVRARLLSAGNDILSEATTDDDGVVRFAAPLLHGQAGSAPRAIHLFGPEDDFAALDLDAASFDLSDRGVAGAPQPGPLDAYVWTDRGIYRPGEVVQAMALLRDAAGAPVDLAARLIVRRPNGQVFLQATPPRDAEQSIHLPIVLSPGAAAGTWTIELRADPDAPPVGQAQFRVDAFVPDRMAVDLGPASGPVVPGRPYALPLSARFLYGAPGAGLSAKAHLHLAWDDAPFPALDGYAVGLAGEVYAPDAQDIDVADTGADGTSSVPITLAHAPDTTHPLKAEIEAEVNDSSGHAARARTDVKVRPQGRLIGLKPAFRDAAIDAGAEAGFSAIAVDADGRRVKLHARLRLVRELPSWHLVYEGRLARFQTVWKDEPLETREVDIPADGALSYAKALDFGRYRIELTEAGGLAATSFRFRAGWVSTDNPDVPDQVDVSADRAAYPPGGSARVHVAAPFAGHATLLVLTDRVHAIRAVEVTAGGTDVDVPVDAAWGPGAYVAVHVFRPADDAAHLRPARAIGLTWLGIDPASRAFAAGIEVPDKLPPRARAIVPVHAEPGAWVTLAAVDEGILRLTNFASPDPSGHFLGRRTLGIDIRDDWGRLIAPAVGEAAELKQGGDSGFALPDIPIRTVTLFAGPAQAGDDGVARVPLDLPDFAGQVRLMAVVWHGTRIGHAQADVLVRDPLVAEPLLPRFLAPGDDARFAVLMQNLELPPGEATADVSVEGPLSVAGPTHLVATLANGAQATPVTTLHATGAGRGVVKLDIAGQGGFAVHRETAITVRPARAPQTLVASAQIAPRAASAVAAPFDRFLPGTAQAVLRLGGPVRYDTEGLIAGLYAYPLMCLEQASSKGFPLAFLPDGPMAGPDRAARLQASVARVLDLQRYDGGFALWSANNDAMPWLSGYATDFLLRARAASAPVPDAALHEALKYLSDMLDGDAPDKPVDWAAQAYALYDLARAGQPRIGLARVFATQAEHLPTPLARAQVAAALALAHDRARAETLFASAMDFSGRKFWYGDDGTALRDHFALVVLLRESGLLPDKLQSLIASLPAGDLDAANLSTQEQSWGVAAAATLGRDGRSVHVGIGSAEPAAAPLVVQALGPAGLAVRNLDDAPVWQIVSITGLPAAPLPAARHAMQLTRQFFRLDGGPLDLDHLRQNTVFVLLLEGRAEDAEEHQAMLLAGLPAGWEIAGRMPAGDIPGMGWLGTLSDTVAQPAADDRYAAVLDLDADKPTFRVAVKLRAVTPGSYELPGAELADMYRPTVFARQAASRVSVLPVE